MLVSTATWFDLLIAEMMKEGRRPALGLDPNADPSPLS